MQRYTKKCGVVLVFSGNSLVRLIYSNYLIPFIIIFVSSEQMVIEEKDFWKLSACISIENAQKYLQMMNGRKSQKSIIY